MTWASRRSRTRVKKTGPEYTEPGCRSAWHKWDPAQRVSCWRTPHLIVHSARDYRLPLSEAMAAFNVLQMRGVDSRLLVFPDENHWVVGLENSLLWHRTVLGFINRRVGLPEDTSEAYAAMARAQTALPDRSASAPEGADSGVSDGVLVDSKV